MSSFCESKSAVRLRALNGEASRAPIFRPFVLPARSPCFHHGGPGAAPGRATTFCGNSSEAERFVANEEAEISTFSYRSISDPTHRKLSMLRPFKP